jgi:hypothetical protein
MAVVEVCPQFTWLEPNKEGWRVYKQIWSAITDQKDDGPITARSGTGLPLPGDPYVWGNDSDQDSVCDIIPDVRLEKQDQGFRKKWAITFTFSNEPRDRCQPIDNPVAEPWEIEGDCDEWEDTTEFATDSTGAKVVAITNSALEPFSANVYRSRRKLVAKKNYSNINLDWIEIYTNSVNSVAITIFGKTYAARTLFMRRIAFTRKLYRCDFYYPTTFNIDINPNTFDIQFPDKGFRKKKATAPSPPTDPREHFEWITGGDGVKDDSIRVREPQFLDGAGNVKAAGSDGHIIPVYRRYRFYRELQWSVFNFPPVG